jgi:4-diphosphocytidyl-2C-methyl-D-erythritol kinase
VPKALDANANAVQTMAEQRDLEKRHQQDHKEINQLKQDLRRKEKALAEAAALLIAAKNPGLLGSGRGELTTPEDRQKAHEIIEEGIAAYARASERRQ